MEAGIKLNWETVRNKDCFQHMACKIALGTRLKKHPDLNKIILVAGQDATSATWRPAYKRIGQLSC